MTTNQSAEILKRLERIEKDLTEIKIQLAESRGALRLAKTVIGLLGLTGIGSLIAWIQAQGK